MILGAATTQFDTRPALETDWRQFRTFLTNDQPLNMDEAAFERFRRKINSSLHWVLVVAIGEEVVYRIKE